MMFLETWHTSTLPRYDAQHLIVNAWWHSTGGNDSRAIRCDFKNLSSFFPVNPFPNRRHDIRMLAVMLSWVVVASFDMKRRRDELYRHEIDLPPSCSICPVCGTSVSKENIGIHVEEHFTQPSTSSETNRFDDLEGKTSSFEARFRFWRR